MEELKLQNILDADKEMVIENLTADPSPAAAVNILERELDRMHYRYAEGCSDENAVLAAGYIIKSVKNSLPFIEAVDDVKEWKLAGETEKGSSKPRLMGIILTALGLAAAAASYFLQLSRTAESASVSMLNTALPLLAGVILIFTGGLFLLKPRKQRRNEDTKLEFRVNPERTYNVLRGIILVADKSLESVKESARLEQMKVYAAQGGSELKPEEAELFSSLLESLYTRRNTENHAEADEMIAGIRYYLHGKNVETVDYSREQAGSFELLPGKKTGTLRPALMASGKLLKKGLASGTEEF